VHTERISVASVQNSVHFGVKNKFVNLSHEENHLIHFHSH